VKLTAAIYLGALLVLASWGAYGGQPSAVYPAPVRTLRFSHLGHEQVSCETCHPNVSASSSTAAVEMPGHATCATCHRQAREGARQDARKPGTCGMCHPPGKSPATSPTQAAAALKFSHRLHSQTPESCRTCHLPENEDQARGLLPAADACAGCHADMLQNRCDACHPAGPEGRLLLNLDGDKLIPSGGHGGEDHGPGWLRSHGSSARTVHERCMVCHTDRSCDNCHRGVSLPLRIHPADWELSHAGPARAGLMDCDKCHRDQSKCLACHRRAHVAESSTDRSPNMRLHPEGYRARHALDARRNIKACASCHAEGDCIRCHGGAGIGTGISPHPPGFSARCRLMRRRNARPCLKCHRQADMEALCR